MNVKKHHPFFCQTISWYHAGGNSHFLKGLISMGFLLYTKDSIHFCISYIDICLFNIDIFLQLFELFLRYPPKIFLHFKKNIFYIDGSACRAIINFINQKDHGLFPSHIIGTHFQSHFKGGLFMERVFNFSAGPSMLPLEVLEQAQKEFVCYGSSGMSVMEMSHRSKVFEGILEKAQADLRDLMHIPDNYKILFLQGGGSTQFAMIPLNLMNKNNKADYVVTGHYARVEKDGNGRFLLKKALDDTKDQSYVLYCLTQEQLSHTIFPLGEMRKSQAREIAESQGFINARKADSQDICFVQNGSYADFIEQYTGKNYPDGDFLDTNGNVIGRH